MNDHFQSHLESQLDEIRAPVLIKAERIITSPQRAHIDTTGMPAC